MSLVQNINVDPNKIDHIHVYTPLGIRFWDPVFDRQIKTDLDVSAYPVSRPKSIVYAQKTWSGNYAFHKLPGLSIFEHSEENFSPPETIPYVIVVTDPSGYYSPTATTITAPHKGLIMAPKGFHLYIAANQAAPRWYASVRGRLLDENTGLPAKYAVVKILLAGVPSFYGLADADGSFLVLMPYPTTHQPFLSSPAISGGVDQLKQRWDISIEVLYAPANVEYYAEVGLPDYLQVLSQANAEIRPEISTASTQSLATELIFNQELIVRTENDSEGRLLVRTIS